MYNKFMVEMLTVVETPEFIATAERVWSNDEREEFIDWIAVNPQAGVEIAGDLRKVRWAAQGKGKRGGARVIYFNRNERGEVVLVTTYTKGRIENIPAAVLRKLAEKYRV
jgi:hypothetical protein